MKVLLVLGLLSSVAVYCHAAPHCHLQELMDCVDIAIDWLHSLPKRSIPETENDVNVMCNEMDKVTSCTSGYRDNCTTPLQKELIGLLLEGAAKLRNDFCTPGSSSRTKYLAHSVCLNKVSQMDIVKEQIEYILTVIEKAQSVERSQFISYICCGYTKWAKEFVKLIQDSCGKETADTLVEFRIMVLAQFPGVVCNAFDDESDHCQAFLPPEGSKPSETVKELAIYQFIHKVLRGWLE